MQNCFKATGHECESSIARLAFDLLRASVSLW